MNHVETFTIEYADEIETKVNRYCRQYNLNPISISITYAHTCFIVALVVEGE